MDCSVSPWCRRDKRGRKRSWEWCISTWEMSIETVMNIQNRYASKNQHFWQHDSHITSSTYICPQTSTTTAKNQQLEHTRPPTSHKNCEIIIAVYKNNCHCGLAENYIIFRTCATSKTIPNKYSGTAKACNSSRISALQWHIINWVTKTWQVISWVRWSNCALP